MTQKMLTSAPKHTDGFGFFSSLSQAHDERVVTAAH